MDLEDAQDLDKEKMKQQLVRLRKWQGPDVFNLEGRWEMVLPLN